MDQPSTDQSATASASAQASAEGAEAAQGPDATRLSRERNRRRSDRPDGTPSSDQDVAADTALANKADKPDKTDMSAVGDDGQVFGG